MSGSSDRVIPWLREQGVPTAVPCPSWCDKAGDHALLPEDHTRPGERLWREHRAAFELAGCSVEFSQIEQAASGDGPVMRQPLTCGLIVEPGDSAMTPRLLHALSDMLEGAAEQLAALLMIDEASPDAPGESVSPVDHRLP